MTNESERLPTESPPFTQERLLSVGERFLEPAEGRLGIDELDVRQVKSVAAEDCARRSRHASLASAERTGGARPRSAPLAHEAQSVVFGPARNARLDLLVDSLLLEAGHEVAALGDRLVDPERVVTCPCRRCRRSRRRTARGSW